MIAQIHQRESLGIDLLGRRQRHEDLSSAACRRDPGRPVDICADVPLGRPDRGARVDPDADPDGAGSQGTTAILGGLERAVRRREREEEGVALGVDLYAAVTSEGLPQHATVLGEQVRVGGLAEPVQQSGRTLDIGEQKRDSSGRQVGAHHRTVLRDVEGRHRSRTCGRHTPAPIDPLCD